jgi:hypothetical protein
MYLYGDNVWNTMNSDWLLLNAKWAYFQLYHGENKSHWSDDNDVCFALEQHA